MAEVTAKRLVESITLTPEEWEKVEKLIAHLGGVVVDVDGFLRTPPDLWRAANKTAAAVFVARRAALGG